ncbi:hypothetical protein Dda_7619 [Drechslerella dactyloides]|uniref:Uncharacterized protein n=1 Tax=Drechslerella dactyloides TaxID=74499 RepID=A0AAD6NGV3_DREDA|nr:hypothetical protein Dda_7619 [Drechslerella dactyloides]
MSVNIPCGSSNPIGFKMPPPNSPAPPPSSETKTAVQDALHSRDRPAHLTDGAPAPLSHACETSGGKEGQSKDGSAWVDVDKTAKEGVEGGRKS